MPDINGMSFGANEGEALPVPPPAAPQALDGITPGITPPPAETDLPPQPPQEIMPPPAMPDFSPPPAAPFVPEAPLTPANETPVVPVAEPYAPAAPAGDILGSVETGLSPVVPETPALEPHVAEPHDLEAAINPPQTPAIEDSPLSSQTPVNPIDKAPVVPEAPYVAPVEPQPVAPSLTTEQMVQPQEVEKVIGQLKEIARRQQEALDGTNKMIADLESGAGLAQRG